MGLDLISILPREGFQTSQNTHTTQRQTQQTPLSSFPLPPLLSSSFTFIVIFYFPLLFVPLRCPAPSFPFSLPSLLLSFHVWDGLEERSQIIYYKNKKRAISGVENKTTTIFFENFLFNLHMKDHIINFKKSSSSYIYIIPCSSCH